MKKVLSEKLYGFEQPYWEAKFANPGSILTEPHYRDENFEFGKFFKSKIFETKIN